MHLKEKVFDRDNKCFFVCPVYLLPGGERERVRDVHNFGEWRFVTVWSYLWPSSSWKKNVSQFGQEVSWETANCIRRVSTGEMWCDVLHFEQTVFDVVSLVRLPQCACHWLMAGTDPNEEYCVSMFCSLQNLLSTDVLGQHPGMFEIVNNFLIPGPYAREKGQFARKGSHQFPRSVLLLCTIQEIVALFLQFTT